MVDAGLHVEYVMLPGDANDGDQQFANIDRRFSEQDAKFKQRFAVQDVQFESRFGKLERASFLNT